MVIGFCKVIPYTIAWASSLTINFTSFKIAFFSVAFTTESLYAVVYLWDLYNGWFWQDETEVFGADEDAGGLWQCGFLSGFSGWGI